MTEKTEPELPQEFIIQQELIDKWFSIPAADTIKVDMPRVMFDTLYQGIEKSYLSQMDLINAIISLASGDGTGVKHHGLLASGKIVAGVNALRHFQTLLMAMATQTEIDDKLQIMEKGPVNE